MHINLPPHNVPDIVVAATFYFNLF